jgi:D-lactate dehydrogenase
LNISRPDWPSTLPRQALRELRTLSGPSGLLTDPADCWPYGYDSSRRQALPQAVVFVTKQTEVEGVIALCNRLHIPVTARGRGTGTTGASIPEHGGVVLSFERMRRIPRIDPANRLAVVEPGLTNEALQKAVGEQGFFWPPDPTSAPVCTVGGNLACNAAGPRAVKYGTPRENTLGLEAITGSGERIRAGVSTTKGVVGYDLTRLIIGSEGTLALITGATLKLTPVPDAKRTLRATYGDMQAAATAVSAIMAQPITPCALEIMDKAAIEVVRESSNLGLSGDTGALLMIEVDGPAHCVDEATGAIAAAARVAGLKELRSGVTAAETGVLWRARQALAPALRQLAPKRINEDVAVPVSRLPELIDGLERLSEETGIRIVSFGHAGNGNLHVNLLVDPNDSGEMVRANRCLDSLFALVLELDGTISGEHGIGILKRNFVSREIDSATLRLMHKIKSQLDPNGILNPEKFLPQIR